MANNRIFYATQQVAISKDNLTTTPQVLRGVQSVSMTTNFTLEQAFELGQLEIFENIEGTPEVEMTINRLLDGSALAYVLAAGGYVNADSVNIASQNQCAVRLGIWDEALNSFATGDPIAQATIVDAYLSNVSYTFGVDGNFTEEIGLTSSEKAWYLGDPVTCENAPWASGFTQGGFGPSGLDAPDFAGGVQRREYFDRTNSIIPSVIPEGKFRLQSVTISADFGREDLFQLGDKGPFVKTANFPIEVTCSIEVLSSGGDQVNAVSSGCATGVDSCAAVSNLTDEQIRVNLCDGTVVDLGTRNKLSSVSYGGGDAGGGNVTTTYDFVTYNKLSVSGTGTVN